MIFLGRILSWALVVIGIFQTALGLFVALNFQNPERAEFAQRYFGSQTTGEATDQGLLWLFAGVALGLLTVIAKNTQSN